MKIVRGIVEKAGSDHTNNPIAVLIGGKKQPSVKFLFKGNCKNEEYKPPWRKKDWFRGIESAFQRVSRENPFTWYQNILCRSKKMACEKGPGGMDEQGIFSLFLHRITNKAAETGR